MESRVRIRVYVEDGSRYLFVVDLDKTFKEFLLMVELKFENVYWKENTLFYP